MPGPLGPGWVQRQAQATEMLKRKQQLAAEMPPAHKHAFELLCSKGISLDLDAGPGVIVRVEPDAILFRGPDGPRTAWVRGTPASGTRVCVEDGFPVEPGLNVLAAFGE